MTDKPISHPDWCQRDRCATNPDGSITHGHLFGTVADIDVVGERTDTPDEGGKVKPGSPRAYSNVKTVGRRVAADMDRVHRLQQKAAEFVGQRNARGGL